MARLAGFEPATTRLEGGCSIQLSYRRETLSALNKWSERKDSNLRPPEPKSGALPNCATLRHVAFEVTLKCGVNSIAHPLWRQPIYLRSYTQNQISGSHALHRGGEVQHLIQRLFGQRYQLSIHLDLMQAQIA